MVLDLDMTTFLSIAVQSIQSLDDAVKKEERPPLATGFLGYYRRVLTAHESRMWHHVNPDMRTWRRKVMIEDTGAAADAAGFEAFLIFDVDETMLAQGA